MTNGGWKTVWQAKGRSRTPAEIAAGDNVLRMLLELDGYESPTSSSAVDDCEVYFRHIAGMLDIRSDESVYEVGCGAGALLYWLHSQCRSLGGADFAESLVEHARAALPGVSDLRHCDASQISPEPRYDVVLSNGVFIYFDDEKYAREALHLMAAKAVRAIGVMDVNDAERRAEFEAMRRLRQDLYGKDYRGLGQLYFEREFFLDFARTHGLSCRIEDSRLPNSINARYRYHVAMFKR